MSGKLSFTPKGSVESVRKRRRTKIKRGKPKEKKRNM